MLSPIGNNPISRPRTNIARPIITNSVPSTISPRLGMGCCSTPIWKARDHDDRQQVAGAVQQWGEEVLEFFHRATFVKSGARLPVPMAGFH